MRLAGEVETAHSAAGRLRSVVDQAASLLPAQGPIGIFVHHNPLHAFEDLTFEDAVIQAGQLLGAEPYMSEPDYRRELARGRIQLVDIDAVLDQENDAHIFGWLHRRALRRAMISPGVREFDAATIVWRMEQGDLKRELNLPAPGALFEACWARTSAHAEKAVPTHPIHEIIHPWLIRLCSVFLDQGISCWPMPDRNLGLYESTRNLFSQRGCIFPQHLQGLDRAFRRQAELGYSAVAVVLEYLHETGCAEADWLRVITSELQALPGWAGIIRQLEKNPAWAPHHPLPCSLMDYLAVRLTMTRVAERQGVADAAAEPDLLKTQANRRLSRAARIYDAARVLRLAPAEIHQLSDLEWAAFTREVNACNGLERRRILHLAYERCHEREVLRSLASHHQYRGPAEPAARPAAQIFFCIDEREESMRRALEEINPRLETYSAAGFFGVAIHYRSIDDNQGAAFCPVLVQPEHSIVEHPRSEDNVLLESRRSRRKMLALLMRNFLVSSRTLVRGWIATFVLGLLSVVPLVGQLLAPRRYALIRAWLHRTLLPRPRTKLAIVRNPESSQPADSGLLSGFTVDEKTERIAAVLRPAGLTRNFARWIIILGHGSTSLNNPHESAHDCGACGGRRGGPNARIFAAMANQPHVRERLRLQGIDIPADAWFIGGYHDTCSDEIELFDLDAVPRSHQEELCALRADLDAARARNAHERVRRFESSSSSTDTQQALRHVRARSEHLAQPRPEYGHCTNAVCIIGRRGLTRNLFLDRRAFLASYDAAQDADQRGLAALLAGVVPVCAGISLEYYFSFVDNDRYGCGTKLPHNITSLMGVMDGHASDLRTGLPLQMVEIHEPVRLLFVIETSPERLRPVLAANAGLQKLADNRWIRIATIDPGSGRVHVLREGRYEEFQERVERLPVALSSAEWYSGQVQHLPMAWIHPSLPVREKLA